LVFKASDLRWPETTAQRYARVVASLYSGSPVPTAAVAEHEQVCKNAACGGVRQAMGAGLIERVGGHRGGWVPKKAAKPAA
jgi:hypothetical protein